MAGTLLGVLAGGVLARRTQERHWLKDTEAEAYAAVLREYTRVEFDLRMAHVERRAPKVDWAPWGAAPTALSLVAEDRAVSAAEQLARTFVSMEAHLHNAEPQQ
ncbi:hypothetical protein [Lentzea flava]|nr:hypothetical protein [Lentzea flava]